MKHLTLLKAAAAATLVLAVSASPALAAVPTCGLFSGTVAAVQPAASNGWWGGLTIRLFGAGTADTGLAAMNSMVGRIWYGRLFSLFGQRWQQIAPAPTPTPPAPTPPAPTRPTPTPPAPTRPTQPTQPNAGFMSAEEQQMLGMVNTARAQAGLQPLAADPQLTQVARLKAQDMVTNHYFGHNSPTLGSPFDLMARYGITYRTAGENIAGNQSVAAAFQALMNSPGHRANILRPTFTRIGIGIAAGGPYGMMFAQEFAG